MSERIDRNESRPPPTAETPEQDQRRRLELELIKIRNEAAAARLEARAAEIELMIRQLGRSGVTDSGTPINPPHHAISAAEDSRPVEKPTHFASWEEVQAVLPSAVPPSQPGEALITRTDSAHPSTPAPHVGDFSEIDSQPVGDFSEIDSQPISDFSEIAANVPVRRTGRQSSETTAPKGAVTSDEVAIESDGEETEDAEEKRSKPAAWLVSAVAHVAVLLILAAVTLQTQRPKDQVALSASAAEANEVSMETFTIESTQPETEPTEITPSETEYELSPIGEIAAPQFQPDAPPSPATAALSSSSSSAAAMSLKSDSDAKIQFCGVEGGGNHFVYLVDSSDSMGDGFESARAELLRSIDVLKPDQRFYVVFFDAESSYMRLANASEDEPRSVYATPQNKTALRRWAMRISMDRGRAPYDPLRFALKLKPDVIFLLSDGEFPQGIEDLLKEENKIVNLFGDRKPISIVHTIGYHSKEGESRMRRIAQQNQGQYRHIPKP